MAEKKYNARIRQIKQARELAKIRSQQRDRKIERRVGKKLMWTERQIIEYIADKKIPTQMQHCILKVREKVPGTDMERFISAFNICGWVFTTYRYQQPNSMTLTSKGLRNNMLHRRELESGSKRARYKALEERLYGLMAQDLIKEREDKAKDEYDDWKQKQTSKRKLKKEISRTASKEKKVKSTKKATKSAKQRMKDDE